MRIDFGGDYNPEQWPEAIWREDMARMREAGVSLVTLGVFSWARIQPAEGVFDFDWLDEIITLLHEAGIGVDLATATASPPPWASSNHPDILPVDFHGRTLGPGSRQHYAPTAPVYRRLAAELTGRIAERYASHPGVVMWHVNNEYACHLHADYSASAEIAFRDWLERRYGTVDALNAAWGSAFWSQLYRAFEEISPPRHAPYSLNPGQVLDFHRFTSDSFLECFLMEKKILREAGARQPITTNFMGAFKPLDYWTWAQHVDVVSDDDYPDPADPDAHLHAAFADDLMRSLKPGRPWMLMEQATGAVNWRPANASKAPGQMTATSMQAVARGARSVMFFQWRQSAAGSEKFHSAMLPHSGVRSRIWHEVKALGAALDDDFPARADADADIALVIDWENWWALEHTDHPVRIDYLATLKHWHAHLTRKGFAADFVHPGSDLGRYRLIIAPALYLLTAEGAANLTGFVHGGGHALVTGFSDLVDEHDRFREGGFLTQLGPMLGLWLDQHGIPSETGGTSIVMANGAAHECHTFVEELHADAATVLATFSAGTVAGMPALTRNAYGDGVACYLGTALGDPGTAAVLDEITAAAGVEPIVAGLPEHVEASRRAGEVYLINHSPEPATVPATAMAPLGRDAELVLPPWGHQRIRHPAG
jgi:beta-galactosidase